MITSSSQNQFFCKIFVNTILRAKFGVPITFGLGQKCPKILVEWASLHSERTAIKVFLTGQLVKR